MTRDSRDASRDPAETIDWEQVRTILWARYRIWFRNATASKWKLVMTVFGFLFQIAFTIGMCAVAIFVTLSATQSDAEAARNFLPADGVRELIHTGALVVFAMLVITPPLGLRSNEFLDVTKLFQLPVSHRTVFAATLFGLAVSPWTIGLVLPLCIATGIAAGLSWTLVPAVLAALLTCACGLAMGHGLLLLWLDLFRSRRWRDFSVVVLTIVGAAIMTTIRFARFSFISAAWKTGVHTVGGVAEKLVILPSFWGANVAVGEGWLRFLPALALPFLLWWTLAAAARVQERVYYGEIEEKSADQGVRRGLPAKIGGLFRGALGAVVEKDLALLFREPGVRIYLVQSMAYSVAPLAYIVFSNLKGKAAETLPWAGGVGLFAVLFGCTGLLFNPLGTEAGGIIHTLQTPVPRSTYLLGKALALLIVLGTMSALLAIAGVVTVGVLAGASPGAIAGYAALGAAETICAAAVVAGLGIWTGVYMPSPSIQRGRRALSQANQQRGGCVLSLIRSLTLLGSAVAVAPVFFLFHHPAILRFAHVESAEWLLLTVPLALAWAAFALWIGSRLGGWALGLREEPLMAEMTKTA